MNIKYNCDKDGMVAGFWCDIHHGDAVYETPITQPVPVCPNCDHPICPQCANSMRTAPVDIDESREYIASTEEGSGLAKCGNCGDYSVEFMLRFLKLIGAPFPPECEDYQHIKREVIVRATKSTGGLSDAEEIIGIALEEFNKGVSGIIKIDHKSGEIWAIPERLPIGWVLSIIRPEER